MGRKMRARLESLGAALEIIGVFFLSVAVLGLCFVFAAAIDARAALQGSVRRADERFQSRRGRYRHP
jgi:hypothetical protein